MKDLLIPKEELRSDQATNWSMSLVTLKQVIGIINNLLMIPITTVLESLILAQDERWQCA
jgi:hypothetical protein